MVKTMFFFNGQIWKLTIEIRGVLMCKEQLDKHLPVQGDVGLVLEDAKGFSHVLWKKNLEDVFIGDKSSGLFLCLWWDKHG